MTESIRVAKLYDDAKIPAKYSEGAAAYDLCSYEDALVGPGERRCVATGVKVTVPPACQANIYSRSGIAAKYSVEVYGCNIGPGETKDVVVDIYNNGRVPYVISKGERIAQIIFIKLFCGDLVETDILGDTKRGAQGWGSTGSF